MCHAKKGNLVKALPPVLGKWPQLKQHSTFIIPSVPLTSRTSIICRCSKNATSISIVVDKRRKRVRSRRKSQKNSNHKQKKLFPFQQFSLSHLNLFSSNIFLQTTSLDHEREREEEEEKHYLIVQRFSSLHVLFQPIVAQVLNLLLPQTRRALNVESFIRSREKWTVCNDFGGAWWCWKVIVISCKMQERKKWHENWVHFYPVLVQNEAT